MNKQRFNLCVLAGFIFIFAYEAVFHGMLLKPLYEQTANLWRSPEEMQNFMAIIIAVQLSITAVLAYIFTRNYEGKGIGEGIRFGLMIGLFSGIAQFGMYSYMPITMNLAISWFGGAIVEMIGLGIIFALIYKRC